MLRPRLKQPRQLIHTIPHQIQRRMAVKVHRDLHLRMPQNVTQRFHVHAVLDCSGSECMTQVMKANMLTPRSIKDRSHGFVDSTGIAVFISTFQR